MCEVYNDGGVVFGIFLFGHPGEHANREARALADFALDGNAAAHQRAQLLAEREAKAGSAVFAGGRAVGLTEILKQPSNVGFGDTDSRILNLDLDPVTSLALAALHRERDDSIAGTFRGCAQKIGLPLPQLGLIGRSDAEI